MVASITSAGLGSGLDINGLITQLMNVEKQPLTALDTKEASYQAKLSAYGTLKSAISSLQSSVNALKADTLYTKNAATSSDTTVLSGTATAAARVGSYSVDVQALASAQSLTSAVFTSTSANLSAINGKLSFQIGTYSGGSFTANEGTSPVSIDITATNSSLTTIRDQINAANAGVRASIVSVNSAGTEYKLAITSLKTGASGSLKITATDSNGVVLNNNTGLAKLSYDPTKTAGTGNEFDVPSPAQDAHVKIDGVDLYRNSNTIGDAITGVSLTLTKVSTATLTVAKDTTAVKTALESFVKSYNDTIALSRQLSNYNTQTQQASILTGDTAARNVVAQLSSMIGFQGNSATSTLRRLSDLGISAQRDGTLEINSTKMAAALNNSSDQVASLLSSTSTSSKGLALQMSSKLSALLADGGVISSRTDGINASIKDIGRRRTTLNIRLTQTETRYRAQFTALDSLVSSMRSTSDYLTQQLASLKASTA